MVDLDLLYQPAVRHAALIQGREISSRELVTAYLERIDTLNPRLNCYLTVAAESALAAASSADSAPPSGRPPFHGVPIAIKDMTDTAGIPTSWGSASLRERIPERDASVVRRLKQQGFIVIGKTNTPEFAAGCTDPVGYGPCRNPWDLARCPSGSSGGSAVAVAAALCSLAQGNDTGGSVRGPAAACGIVGLKPSRGRVANDLPGFDYLSQEGPLARTVEDVAALLDCMSGNDPGDAVTACPPASPFRTQLAEKLPPLRVAALSEAAYRNLQASWPEGVTHGADPVMWEGVQRVARELEGFGHRVSEAAPDWGGPAHMDTTSLHHTAAWMALPDLPSRNTLDPIQQQAFARLDEVSLLEYLRTLNSAQLRARQVEAFWDGYDVLVLPTLAQLPPLVAELRLPDGTSPVFGEGVFTYFWNITGQPAISVPAHRTESGFPVGVQLVGRRGEEGTLLRAALQLEGAIGWERFRPQFGAV